VNCRLEEGGAISVLWNIPVELVKHEDDTGRRKQTGKVDSYTIE
jgi:hypothetical protein